MIKYTILLTMHIVIMVFIMTPFAFGEKGDEITLIHFVEEVNWPPFTPNIDGKVTEGLSFQLMKEIFSRLNIEIELELLPQKRMLNYLKEGLKEELAYLNEIFSTKDAFIGLTNVGKRGIKYEGK